MSGESAPAPAATSTSLGERWRQARSVLAMLGLVPLFTVGGVLQRCVVWPLVLLFPARRHTFVGAFFKFMSRGITGILEVVGGARGDRRGRLPTREPILIIGNHQSLLDICNIGLIADPFVPQFVTRTRYRRFVPSVSLCLRLMQSPLIDPRERRATLEILARAARDHPHGLVIFPEGHRTRDGDIQPFQTLGLERILRERPLPVWLVINDGYWVSRRFVDFILNVHRIRGRTEVLGPFAPPGPGEPVAAFIERMRGEMVGHLARMRSGE